MGAVFRNRGKARIAHLDCFGACSKVTLLHGPNLNSSFVKSRSILDPLAFGRCFPHKQVLNLGHSPAPHDAAPAVVACVRKLPHEGFLGVRALVAAGIANGSREPD